MVKGNDGKGARKKLAKQLALILGAFAAVLFVTSRVCQKRSSRLVQPSSSLQHHHASSVVNSKAATVRDAIHNINQHPPRDGDRADNRLRRKKVAAEEEEWDPDQSLLDDIRQARVALVALHADQSALSTSKDGHYRGIYGQFCKIDWSSHKEDPALTPMFRDVQNQQADCKRARSLELTKAVNAARGFDRVNVRDDAPKPLDIPLVVFHESRCGSTLVANILQAASPTEHRVYSESQPPLFALQVCGEAYDKCSMEVAISLFRDVLYLMSRSNDPLEKRAFFKIQSLASKNIPVFQEAFPNTPWIYVYREGVEVMMSHLNQGVKRALCVSSRKAPGRMAEELAQRHGTVLSQLSDVEYCALHLAALTESAAESVDEYAIPVNYKDLPTVLYEQILPAIGITLGEAELHRIEHAAQTYAKGSAGRYRDFQEDSEKKESMASPEVKAAAAKFLQPSFEELEAAAKERKQRNYKLP